MLVKLSYENLSRIKSILEEFGNMSGLICNVEKTVLLQIGTNEQIDPRITELGFSIVDKITILGLKIDRTGITDDNMQAIRTKVLNQIAVWRPFNLSLPGRINIAKTMLYSQINYLGCFVPMSERIISELENLIVDYVKGKMNIAKKRIFLPPDNGGLGLFNLRDFLDAQKCAWVKRSKDLTEPWKIIIYVSNHGNLYNVKGDNVDRLEYPICHNISKSFERFTDMYIKHNENFREGYIFDSKSFTIGLESRVSLNRNHFDNLFFIENSSKLYKLKYDNFYDNQGNLIGLNEIRESTGLPLTELHIYRCRGICSTAKIKYSKKELNLQKTVSIETLINRKKKAVVTLGKFLWEQQKGV